MAAISPATTRRRLQIGDWLLFAVSLGCGVAYLVARGLLPFPGNVVVKALSVSPLAFVAFHLLRGRDGLLLGVSLLFSSLGDVFLALDGERFFVFGLGSFLIAHLLYVALFVHNWPKPVSASAGQKSLVTLLMLYSGAMLAWLWPDLGSLSLPVSIYLCAITAMGATAALAGFKTRLIITGAVLFIISDSLIATGKFKTPVESGDYLVWGTYYLGQLLIAGGFLREKMRL